MVGDDDPFIPGIELNEDEALLQEKLKRLPFGRHEAPSRGLWPLAMIRDN
jgi:hypothetical protein